MASLAGMLLITMPGPYSSTDIGLLGCNAPLTEGS